MSNARFGLRVRNGLVRGITEGFPSLDADALAFINAAGITDVNQIGAINLLVIDLKTFGLWTKMKAIYPFVGGTASTHKWNLKDPRDLDAAYRIVFAGGWTHGIGITPNGTNTYADTFFLPSSGFTLSNGHFSIYSRTNVIQSSCDFGTTNGAFGASDETLLMSNFTGLGFIPVFTRFSGSSVVSDSLGLFITNRNSTTITSGWKNSNKIFNQIQSSIILPSLSLNIGCQNATTRTRYSSRNYSFASIGDGLTDTEAADLYTAVQTFQTTLGRQV